MIMLLVIADDDVCEQQVSFTRWRTRMWICVRIRSKPSDFSVTCLTPGECAAKADAAFQHRWFRITWIVDVWFLRKLFLDGNRLWNLRTKSYLTSGFQGRNSLIMQISDQIPELVSSHGGLCSAFPLIGGLDGNSTLGIHSHVLAHGAPSWVHAASASCVCVRCLPPVCLMPACRPCHVSHTEPNAINVSAYGAALWGRGHGWSGGADPEQPPQHPARRQQHVSTRQEERVLLSESGKNVIYFWCFFIFCF